LLFPTIIAKLGNDYNNAFVLVEINDNGQQIADILHDELEYENILGVTRLGVKGQCLSNGFGKVGTIQLGVRTTKVVKSLGCVAIKTLVEENKFIIHDQETISEFSTFIESRGSYTADSGYHDDLVMNLVLFGWMTTQQFFKDLTNMSIREKIFQARADSITHSFTPFMRHTTGLELIGASGTQYPLGSSDPNLNTDLARFNSLSNEEIDDLKWLLS
jgi:hypothetical protein